MITAYCTAGKTVKTHHLVALDVLPDNTIWLDIDRPTAEELAFVNKALKLQLGPLRTVRQMEQARQYMVQKKLVQIALPIIVNSSSATPEAGTLMLAMTKDCFVTYRGAESKAVRNFAEAVKHDALLLQDASSAMVTFMNCLTGRLADLAEVISDELQQVGKLVFQESLDRAANPGKGKAASWHKVLQGLGKTARLNHRLIDTLSGCIRTTDFLLHHAQGFFSEQQQSQIQELRLDAHRLQDHATAMMNESNFLLDAIVGAISIEQNNVIKIFSMVAVILMPPTMVASIYGMNFSQMPELSWPFGYPLALLVMAISGLAPWLWFKRRGWF